VRPVDLDIGRVQIDRRSLRAQATARVSRQTGERPRQQRRVRGLDTGDPLRVEALGQRDERGRRRRVRHRPQLGAGRISAAIIDVAHEVPAGQHRLGHRQHQPARSMALPTGLDRTDRIIDRRDDRQHAIQLGHQHQTRRRGQVRVVAENIDSWSRRAYRVHQTGAFLSGSTVAVQPRLSRKERHLSRTEPAFALYLTDLGLTSVKAALPPGAWRESQVRTARIPVQPRPALV
jgi:hypothetical protein